MNLYAYNSVIINKDQVFADNLEWYFDYDADAQTNYTMFRIYQKRTDEEKQYPFVRNLTTRTTAMDLVKSEGWLLAVNGGIGEGLVIENSQVITDEAASYQSGVLPLFIKNDGSLTFGPADTTGKGSTYVGQGVVSACCGFYPIIVDYDDYDYPTVPHTEELPEWYHAQRQIIGQFGNGDYAIITGEGRSYDNSVGLTMADAQTLCKKLGLKFAYNLDGGGSTQTVYGRRYVNSIYEGTSGRKRNSFIVFNGTDSFGA